MMQASWGPTATRPMLEERAALFGTRARLLRRARRARGRHALPHQLSAKRCAHPLGPCRISRCTHALSAYLARICDEAPTRRRQRRHLSNLHVVRTLERSRVHNSEFTLLEWYRIGFSLDDLMTEVEALVSDLAGPAVAGVSERVTYRDVFRRALALDPFAASDAELAQAPRFPASRAALVFQQAEMTCSTSSWACASGPGLGRRG